MVTKAKQGTIKHPRELGPMSDAREKELRGIVRESTKTMDSFKGQLDELSSALFEATTHRGMTTPDDFRAGHKKRAEIWESFAPVLGQYEDARRARFSAWHQLTRAGKPAA